MSAPVLHVLAGPNGSGKSWELVAEATRVAHRAHFYDNSRADAFAPVADFELGRPAGTPTWPAWTPATLIAGL